MRWFYFFMIGGIYLACCHLLGLLYVGYEDILVSYTIAKGLVLLFSKIFPLSVALNSLVVIHFWLASETLIYKITPFCYLVVILVI